MSFDRIIVHRYLPRTQRDTNYHRPRGHRLHPTWTTIIRVHGFATMLCGLRKICFVIGVMVILIVWSSWTSVESVAGWRPDLTKVDLKNPVRALSETPETSPSREHEQSGREEEVFASGIESDVAKAKKEKERKEAGGLRSEAGEEKAKNTSEAKKPNDADQKSDGKGRPQMPHTPGYPEPDPNDEFNEIKFKFQNDLETFAMPEFDARLLRRYKPHNYHGPGHETFATVYATRNATLYDPYFVAAQQMAYRLLWDPNSKSIEHPLTVFVAPFVEQNKRDLLQAAGAIVRELDLLEWHPEAQTYARWRDLFMKLNMWEQTDFSRIAFLDLDAFPVVNIDKIFDIAPSKKCDKSKLSDDDKSKVKDICKYTFTGTQVPGYGINVGVMVFSPNKAMHMRLLRLMRDEDKYDSKMAEQAFLSYAYSPEGPFSPSFISREWNGYFPQPGDEGAFKIVHEKLWSNIAQIPWARDYFNGTWTNLLELYASESFVELRKADGLREY